MKNKLEEQKEVDAVKIQEFNVSSANSDKKVTVTLNFIAAK